VDPRVSPHITPYDIDDVMEKKPINKKAFQERMGLAPDPEAPLFFWPSRLYAQKGPSLLQKIVLHCMDRHGIQVALVANGDPRAEAFFERLAGERSGRIARKAFEEDLSVLGKSGSDYVLMPSLYEPCGLPQMECPRFGTLPVGRLTGGIKDTVRDLDAERGTGNGFVFQDFTPEAFQAALERAVAFHARPAKMRKANLQRIMGESFKNFSLENTAKKYIQVYENLIAERNAAPE
jgi:glycogen synthase